MKTKISHLGRSSVSVILAVMMLLSTMLIGTVSTVNAADIQYYYRGSDNDWNATAMTQSTDGKYFYIQSSNAENQFKIAKSTTTFDYNSTYVQKGFNNTDVQNISAYGKGDYSKDNCYVLQSGTYYILVYVPGTDINKTNNPIICASTTLPQASVPVAESVKLTASPETVKVGNSVTLSAVANSPASTNLKYTFTKTSGGDATVVQDNDKLTVTPTAAGTYEYTVTVSANGYSDVTSAKVTITASYTATQQAYVDLETYVNSVQNTSSGSYTEDSYADFSAALKSAQDLLKGLPNADASNTDEYTTALNKLTNAYQNLKSNKQYYILGHSAITGRTDDTSSATTHDNGVPMKDNGNGDYTYTFSSPDIKSGNDAFCFYR